ncbi:MAG TPA: NAD(P)-dependent alcohol dehydrogenase, partial [Chloroflexota bacterium]|nr:NAD(P)-dependent alcohol dehydrogenase [Chloroflexota bacterium]
AADIEVIPIDKVNEAYDRAVAKDVRFRFVIDNSTLPKVGA